jgi:hypothetical protein
MAKKILLIDFDSKMPNLALMKLSKYYKERGDVIGFRIKNPDLVYISVIYPKNRNQALGIKKFYPNSKVVIGGSGYSLKSELPKEIELLKPDYDLYPKIKYSLGYTTRGCNRNCDFCIVHEKEGKFRICQSPEAFYDKRFENIVFLDNNILFDKAWFRTVLKFCKERRLKVWFTQGLDIRLLEFEDAILLKEMAKYKTLTFAWDNISLEKIIEDKIKLLKEVKLDIRREIMFYVYLENDNEFKSALYRCKKLKELGTTCFLMFNQNNRRTKRIIKLQRWANRKSLYFSCNFEDFLGKRHR